MDKLKLLSTSLKVLLFSLVVVLAIGYVYYGQPRLVRDMMRGSVLTRNAESPLPESREPEKKIEEPAGEMTLTSTRDEASRTLLLADDSDSDEGKYSGPEESGGEDLDSNEDCSAGSEFDEYEVGSFCASDGVNCESSDSEDYSCGEGDEGDEGGLHVDLLAEIFEKIAEPMIVDLDFDTSSLQADFIEIIESEITACTESLSTDDELSADVLQTIITNATRALDERLGLFALSRRRSMTQVREAVHDSLARDAVEYEKLKLIEGVRDAVRGAFKLTDAWVDEQMPDDNIELITADVRRQFDSRASLTKRKFVDEGGNSQEVFSFDSICLD